jgi:hypothetical protein
MAFILATETFSGFISFELEMVNINSSRFRFLITTKKSTGPWILMTKILYDVPPKRDITTIVNLAY